MSKPIDRVLARLPNARRNGNTWAAKCPAHDDHVASLSVTEGDDGRALILCHAGCDTETVVAALGLEMRDLFPDDNNNTEPGRETRYPYRDDNEQLLYTQVRIDYGPGRKKIWTEPKGVKKRTLYRLNEMLHREPPDRWVLIPEGEKCADRLIAEGFIATTNSHGAKGWRDNLANHLVGAKVALLADNDDEGRQRVEKAAQSLHGKAATVRVVDLPDLPPKGDVVDWFNNGGTTSELKQRIEQAPEWEPDTTADDDQLDDDQVQLDDDQLLEDGQAVAPDGYRLTDTGNASRLIDHLNGRARYVHAWGKWIVYGPGVWVIDENDAIMTHEAKGVARTLFKALATTKFRTDKQREAFFNWAVRSESSGAIAAMVRLARGTPGILVEHEQLDADPDILNCRNGTVNLRTGELRPHDPADLCTKRAPVDYRSGATAPLWAACLETWQPDKGMRDYLQVEAGAATTGRHTETLSVHLGAGANGKSRYFGAIQHALGDYTVVPHKSLLMTDRYEQHETVKADLFRARLAVASETKATDVLDDEQVKAITGGDRQRARRMREDPWYFNPTHTLVTFSNHRVRVRGRDEGIWRRLRLIPWTVTIPPNDRDERLGNKLQREAEGILAWCVAGARQFLTEKTEIPDTVRQATNDYRSEEDLPRRFVDETLTFKDNTDTWIEAGAIVQELEEWANGLGVEPPDMREIATILREHGCDDKVRRVGDRTRRIWVGVTLRPEVGTQ